MQEILKQLIADFPCEDENIYFFPKASDKKSAKKLANAKQSYAPLSDDEEVYILCDNTVFGNAKNGFILTSKALYANDISKDGIDPMTIHSFGKNKLLGTEIYNAKKEKIGALDFAAIDKDVAETILHILTMYSMILRLVAPMLEQGISNERLVTTAIARLKESNTQDFKLSMDDFAEVTPAHIPAKKREDADPIDDIKTPKTSSRSAHYESVPQNDSSIKKEEIFSLAPASDYIPKVEKWMFLALTPLYLFLVYYKTVMGADLNGLITVSIAIFILYLPIQILISEHDLPLSFDLVFKNAQIIGYLRLVFLIMGLFVLTMLLLAGADLLSLSRGSTNNIALVIALPMYGLWWLLTSRLIKMAVEGSDATQVKMMGWLLFILALILANYMSKLPDEIGFEYFLALIFMIFKASILVLFLIPSVGIKVFWYALMAIGISSVKSLFRINIKKKSSGGVDAIEEHLQKPLGALLFVLMFVVPLINWISEWIEGINPFWAAMGLSVSMIMISAMGAYFQLNIFMGAFIKEQVRSKKISLIALAVFYGVMVVNMGIVSTIDTSSKRIAKMQKDVSRFNDSLQNRFGH